MKISVARIIAASCLSLFTTWGYYAWTVHEYPSALILWAFCGVYLYSINK